MHDKNNKLKNKTALGNKQKIPGINLNYLSVRRNLGILGIFLPIVLPLGNGFTLEPSISDFYYTNVTVIFTGSLCAFGIFLFSYRGYSNGKVLINDNLLTNVAGLFIFLVALIPTTGEPSLVDNVPNGHTDPLIGAVHLTCAAIFFFLMGWMSFFHFTRTNQKIIDPVKRKRNKIYRICAWGIWISVAILLIEKITEINKTGYDTFIGETLAMWFFGLAWLVKGKALKSLGI